MKGRHHITVENKRIRYDFEIKRNLTILRGNSATGKTTLVDMIREYYENGISSGVTLLCDKECAVIEGRTWAGQLSMIRDSIVFIDEGNDFVMTDAFSSYIQNSDNYYVIITREGIPSLPYSVDEIYGIRDSGKYGNFNKTYNQFFHIYLSEIPGKSFTPKVVITEDSNSGYQFFDAVCKRSNDVECISANGKSNVFAAAVEHSDQDVLLIADGAAFGSEVQKLEFLLHNHPNIKLFLPESFEWLLLHTGLMEDPNILDILQHPEDFIESQKWFSWERFFTALLIRSTQESYLKYNKKELNPNYLQKKIADKILLELEKIHFETNL